jgi:regulator of protease activity HflC (stomatin/prohibitin superfamily)
MSSRQPNRNNSPFGGGSNISFDNTYISLPKQLSGCLALAPVALILLVVFLIFGTKQVDAGETCVRLRFGDVSGTVGPGLHLAVPFADNFRCYSLRIVVYEVSNDPGTSTADYAAFSAAFNTPDGQEARANFTVIWRIQPEDAECVYRETGRDMDEVNARAITAITRSRVRLLSGRFTAIQLFSGRIDQNTEVDVTDTEFETVIETLQEEIRADIEPRLEDQCVTVVDFLLRKYDFNEEFVRSRERLRSAEADAERAQVIANGEAEAERLRAAGQADALQTIADTLAGYDAEDANQLIQLQYMDSFADNITFGLVPDTLNPFIQLPEIPAAETSDTASAGENGVGQ